MKHNIEQTFQFFTPLSMLFIGVLLTANVLGPKPIVLGQITLPAGLLVFPITYLIGVLITEVYGFRRSRQVIWMGLFCNLLMALALKIAIALPYDPRWTLQSAYVSILGQSSRLMMLSIFTYFIGEFINSMIVAKLKAKMQGKNFFLRGLCGNWIGEGIETLLFVPLAFSHLPKSLVIDLLISYYVFKVIYAFCAMPMVTLLVTYLKNKECLSVASQQSLLSSQVAV